jgi:hypothetical protein
MLRGVGGSEGRPICQELTRPEWCAGSIRPAFVRLGEIRRVGIGENPFLRRLIVFAELASQAGWARHRKQRQSQLQKKTPLTSDFDTCTSVEVNLTSILPYSS